LACLRRGAFSGDLGPGWDFAGRGFACGSDLV
jgi:hypothetical protein